MRKFGQQFWNTSVPISRRQKSGIIACQRAVSLGVQVNQDLVEIIEHFLFPSETHQAGIFPYVSDLF